MHLVDPKRLLLLAALLAVGCRTPHQEYFDDGSIRRQGAINPITRNMVGPWVNFYPSGTKRSEGSYDGDLQIGHWRFYRDGGGLEMQGDFRNEAREGVWTFYHPNGQVSARGPYRRDDQDGYWVYWDEAGNVTQEGEFRLGRLALDWTYYYAGDGPKARGYFLDGAKVGRWEFWDEAGQLAVKEYPLPADTELVREAWEDGVTPRREGFLVAGKREGRWATQHRNGVHRISGDFYHGGPYARWHVYDGEGKLLGSGNVRGQKLESGWTYTKSSPVGDRPAQPATGEWSSASLAGSDTPANVAQRWLDEMLSPLEPGGFAPPPTPEADAPTESEIEETAPRPEEIVVDSDLSVKERSALDQLVNAYEGRGLAQGTGSAGGQYTPAAPTTRAPTGDTELSAALVGKKLPITRFRTATGEEIDLAKFEGEQNVILVILRGFMGRICVYCTAQTRAYRKAELLDQIRNQDGQVVVVYPGPKGALRSFLRAYRAEFDGADPPFPLVYDEDVELTTALGIVGDRAKPSTLILDKSGVIRYAYVAERKQDRLGAEWLVEELQRVSGE